MATKLYRMEPELKALYGAMRYVAGGKPIHNEEWLDRVRAMPCCKCQRPAPSTPHHIFGSFGSGMKNCKTSDIYTVPLCLDCHRALEGKMEAFLELFVIWFKLNDIFVREQIGWE